MTTEIYGADKKPWPSWKMQPPPEGAPGVGPWVYQKYLMMRAHRDRQGLVELWAHNHELLRNRIFKNRSKFTQVTANLFFKVHNALKANLTDNKPRASISPVQDTGDHVADAWQARYDTWWDTRKQQWCLQESVGKSELYGVQTDEMRFNPDLEGGMGEIETHRWDTYSVLFYPGHLEVQTQPMMCTYEAMELGEIYDIWPEAEDKVNADAAYSDPAAEARQWTRGNKAKDLRPEGQATGYVVPGGDGPATSADRPGGGIQRAMVIRFWVKDYSMMWVDPRTGEKCKKDQQLMEPMMMPVAGPDGQPVPDETGQAPQMQQVMDETGQPMMQPAMNPETGEPIVPEEWSKYPGFIRFIAVTNRGELVLEDAPNPSINPEIPRTTTANCYLFDKFPFLKRFSYSDDISEYGLCIFEQIETLVIEICKKLTMYGIHIDQACRNPLILPKGCGVADDNVNNLPARIWRPIMSMAQQIRFVQTPPGPQEALAYIELLIKLVDMITGITDVSEGRRPTGVTAAHAIAALQEKAQTIYREKIRNNDLYLEEQGRMFISLGQNFYTEEQQLRYEGKGPEQMIDFKGIDFQGELAFKVEAGSTLPRNRAVRQAQVIELAKTKPNFPNKVLLQELAIPNHDEIAAQMDAGPVGMAFQKVAKTGHFTDEDLQFMQQIASMDDKSYNKAFPQAQNPMAGG